MSNRKRPVSSIADGDPLAPPPKRHKITNQIVKRFQNYAQNTSVNDVTFVVGAADSEQTFSANKLIFSAQSKVFDTMLFGPLAVSSDEPIQIRDVDPKAFDYLHQIFYMKQPQLTFDIIVDVFYAAKKYMIDIVITQCMETLQTIHEMEDLYVVLSSFGHYAQTAVFDEEVTEFMTKAKFVRSQIDPIIEDDRFISLEPFIIQCMIKTDIISTETRKYDVAKKYCIATQNIPLSWQSLFKTNFLKHIKLERLTRDYLLNVVMDDDIVSDRALLQTIRNQQKTGFKLSEVLLTEPQWRSLNVGDLVDNRDAAGNVFVCKVVGKHEQYITLTYVKYPFARDVTLYLYQWGRVARYGSITKRRKIHRDCMKQVKVGDMIRVNGAYHPTHGAQCENKWVKYKVLEANVCGVKVKLNGFPNTSSDYYICKDSQDECGCSNSNCDFCCIDA